MRLIERYLFRQLLGTTVLTVTAMTGIALLTSSLSALDILVSQHQTAMIFLQVTLLATPQILSLILPLSILIAAIVALNRLHTEQEIVICYASGMSPLRVASPILQLASMVAILVLVLNLWVQPACYRELRNVLEAVRADLPSTMITPGQFTHPGAGLTVYAQSMDNAGNIRNLFIDQTRSDGVSATLMAREGRFAKRDGSPVLLLRGGTYQQLARTGSLNTVSFDEYPLELGGFVAPIGQVFYRASDRYLHELFFPDLRQAWDRDHGPELLAEAHARLASPLYALAFAAVALAALLGGTFSRLGYVARIVCAYAAALVTRVLGFVASAASASNPSLDVLQYATPLLCFAVAMYIVLNQHPKRGPALQRALVPAGTPA